jgi:integrase/recombinase XerD
VKIVSFTEKEMKDMLNFYNKRSFLDVRNRAILSMLFDTGIRCEEMLSMMPDQIQKGLIVINGKGSKQRLVPLSPVLQKALQQYERVKERYFRNRFPAGNLFLSKTGKPLTNEMIRHIMREAAEMVGVRETVRVSPHTCRHTYAHTQLRNGCDIYTLSRLLGHESVSITQRYLEGIQDEQVLSVGLKHSPLMNLDD